LEGCLREKNFVYLGKIVRARGIKGEVKVVPYTKGRSILGNTEEVYLISNNINIRKLVIKKVTKYKKNYFVTFNFIDDRNQAEELVGSEIAVEKSKLPLLPDDNFYVFNLFELKVFATDKKDIYIGEVIDVIEAGSNDVLIVRKDDKEYLIPLIKDVVKKVSLEEGKIFINVIEGLLS